MPRQDKMKRGIHIEFTLDDDCIADDLWCEHEGPTNDRVVAEDVLKLIKKCGGVGRVLRMWYSDSEFYARVSVFEPMACVSKGSIDGSDRMYDAKGHEIVDVITKSKETIELKGVM